ncbi:MAG: hypothetical protein FGM32_11795 [Candidatus Kapabacteria bacterium]|nr:hypothetical protein [Candidatus Kapabacteria bacterium]
MILWIVLTFLTPVSAVLMPALSIAIAVAALAMGLVLHVMTASFITPNYIDLQGRPRLMLASPPMMVSALYFAMLGRWMQRMGFGQSLRIWVTTIAFVSLIGPFVPSSAAVPLITAAIVSANWRVKTGSPFALIPAAASIGISIMLRFVFKVA